MFGLVMIGAAVVLMVRVAEMEGRSQVVWGAVTAGLCILSVMFIPFPFVNVVIGLVLAFGAMFAAKALTE